ncbi:MAG TPA: GNAT family N-acetyltransferase [Myxococcaceae bacterium]|nr:GNAT family N-acetyltransferase [Myxococcaceae bacterium]
MALTTAALTPAGWKDVETLFGPRGACGGCWCMFWRLERGERFDELKGERLKARFRAGVLGGTVHGVLAYDDGVPVGWATFGPRTSFARLERSPSLACGDAERVWSIPCFFVRRGHRGRGVARALLEAALAEMRRTGVSLVEGYPVKPTASGAPLPAAFAYTGTRSLFDVAGFRLEPGAEGHSRQRVRRTLRPSHETASGPLPPTGGARRRPR